MKTRKCKHGHSGTRLYKKWRHMHDRCENPNNRKFAIYGGNGITVCPEWSGKQGSTNFIKWALENGYKDGLTIERIDGTKGYSPDNCIWASYTVQNNNTSRNHYITFNGKTQTMKQWADELNISYQALAKRINKLGWSIEKALTTK